MLDPGLLLLMAFDDGRLQLVAGRGFFGEILSCTYAALLLLVSMFRKSCFAIGGV